MQFTRELREEYELRFATCVIDPKRAEEVEHAVTAVVLGRTRYAAVGAHCGVPWFIVGLLHHMEAGSSFKCHLHNGDPLTAQTVNVPKGRPLGTPPFAWEESALDALAYDGFSLWHDWSLAGCLFKMEAFNGWGYRSHNTPSAYLWSGSTHYRGGKYVADRVWSATAVSKQTGAAVVLRRLVDQGFVSFPNVAR